MATDPSFRLEEALCVFEDVSFITLALDQLRLLHPELDLGFEFSVEPQHRHATALRGMLLGALTGKGKTSTQAFEALISDPRLRALYNWSKHSRRIFSLSRDLQILLGATDIDHVQVGDIRLPFETFAITLPVPIVGTGTDVGDLIMLSREQDSETGHGKLTVLVYSTGYAGYKPISRIEKAKLLKLVKSSGKHLRGARLLQQYAIEINSRPQIAYTSAIIGDFSEEYDPSRFVSVETIGESLEQIRERLSLTNKSAEILAIAWRIALGFCLYLETCTTGNSPESVMRKGRVPASSRKPRMVLHGAEVCMVQSAFTLTPEERKLFSAGLTGSKPEVSPHFRRGYWSRPPGKGDDPNAAKTVWHRPSIVRRDRLKEGALPLGSHGKVE